MTCLDLGKLCHHWFIWWLVACSATSHYLKQCGLIVHWTIFNHFKKVIRNSNISIKYAFQNAACKKVPILWRPQCIIILTAVINAGSVLWVGSCNSALCLRQRQHIWVQTVLTYQATLPRSEDSHALVSPVPQQRSHVSHSIHIRIIVT